MSDFDPRCKQQVRQAQHEGGQGVVRELILWPGLSLLC